MRRRRPETLPNQVKKITRKEIDYVLAPHKQLSQVLGLAFFVLSTEPNANPHAYVAVRAMRSAELDWAKRWGVWPDTAQAGLENILAVADERQGVAFTPLEPTPGVGGRRVIYVIADAGGLRTNKAGDELPEKDQPGRAAILFEGIAAADDVDTHMSEATLIGWRYEKWPMATLRRASASSHSTLLEGINSGETLEMIATHPKVARASDAVDGVDVVEYLDSKPFVALSRKMASSKAGLTEELVLRSEVLAKHANMRVFTQHFHREAIDCADGASKADGRGRW